MVVKHAVSHQADELGLGLELKTQSEFRTRAEYKRHRRKDSESHYRVSALWIVTELFRVKIVPTQNKYHDHMSIHLPYPLCQNNRYGVTDGEQINADGHA